MIRFCGSSKSLNFRYANLLASDLIELFSYKLRYDSYHMNCYKIEFRERMERERALYARTRRREEPYSSSTSSSSAREPVRSSSYTSARENGKSSPPPSRNPYDRPANPYDRPPRQEGYSNSYSRTPSSPGHYSSNSSYSRSSYNKS